jgi:hypothetical protein
MERKLIENICKQVYKKFPEVNGIQPVLSERPENQTLLVFKGSATTADGHAIQRIIRVVSDQTGKIVKMTTSR